MEKWNFSNSALGNALASVLKSTEFWHTIVPNEAATERNVSMIHWPVDQSSGNFRFWALVTFGTFLSFLTFTGNLLVLLSFKIEKKLRIISNYFLFSLAIADLAVGFISLPLMTLYVTEGRWTLGYTLCQFWLSVDYCTSNASVYNLLLISLDRYLSLTRPFSYRPKRTMGKAMVMICSTFIVSATLWPPLIISWPHIEGRFATAADECIVQFLKTSRWVTVITAMLAFYLPVVVMVTLYAKIFALTQSRQRNVNLLQEHVYESLGNDATMGTPRLTKGFNNPASLEAAFSTSSVVELSTEQKRRSFRNLIENLSNQNDREESSEFDECDSNADAETDESVDTPRRQRSVRWSTKRRGADGRKPSTRSTASGAMRVDGKVGTAGVKASAIEATAASTDEPLPTKPRNLPSACSMKAALLPLLSSTVRSVSFKSVVAGSQPRRSASQLQQRRQRAERRQETKAAKTLAAILLAFIVTWTPYNVVVCLEAFHPKMVPNLWFLLSYFLCYINSTVNPFCYALCNATFRHCFYRLLTGRWCKKYRKVHCITAAIKN